MEFIPWNLFLSCLKGDSVQRLFWISWLVHYVHAFCSAPLDIRQFCGEVISMMTTCKKARDYCHSEHSLLCKVRGFSLLINSLKWCSHRWAILLPWQHQTPKRFVVIWYSWNIIRRNMNRIGLQTSHHYKRVFAWSQTSNQAKLKGRWLMRRPPHIAKRSSRSQYFRSSCFKTMAPERWFRTT